MRMYAHLCCLLVPSQAARTSPVCTKGCMATRKAHNQQQQQQQHLMPTEKQRRPGQIECQLNGIHGQSSTMVLPPAIVPYQPRGCAHQCVQDWPDNSKYPAWRIPRGLPQVLIPATQRQQGGWHSKGDGTGSVLIQLERRTLPPNTGAVMLTHQFLTSCWIFLLRSDELTSGTAIDTACTANLVVAQW